MWPCRGGKKGWERREHEGRSESLWQQPMTGRDVTAWLLATAPRFTKCSYQKGKALPALVLPAQLYFFFILLAY